MRSPGIILLLVLFGLAAAGPSFAASWALPKSHRPIVPPPPASSDAPAPAGLRGPLSATDPASATSPPSAATSPPSAAASASASKTAPVVDLPPASGLTRLSGVGLGTPPQISGLKPVGDPAPICRAECSKSRIFCAAADSADCDQTWSQCVVGCSAPTLQ